MSVPDSAALPSELVEANIARQRVEAVLPAVLARGLLKGPKLTTTVFVGLAAISKERDLETLVGKAVDAFTPSLQKEITAHGFRPDEGEFSVGDVGLGVHTRTGPSVTIPIVWTAHAHAEREQIPGVARKPRIVPE